MSIIARIKNIEENEKARPWAIAAARCANPHSPIPFTGIDAEDGKDLVTWEGGVPKWKPVSKMCTMGCRHPACVLEQSHKGENPGEYCGSRCGIVHNNFTIQSHMPRVFEDDSPEAAAAKIFAEEDAELRRRELVTITAHDLPGQSDVIVWTANNRYNQCQMFLPFLEDGEGGRPGGFWLWRGEVDTAKVALRAICVEWGKGGCDETNKGNPLIWTIAITLQMVARRESGFAVATKELQSFVTLTGLYEHLSQFKSETRVTDESTFSATGVRGKEEREAARHLNDVHRRSARVDALGKTSHMRHEKLLVVHKLLIKAGVWDGEGLNKHILLMRKPGLILSKSAGANLSPKLVALGTSGRALVVTQPMSGTDTDDDESESEAEADPAVAAAMAAAGAQPSTEQRNRKRARKMLDKKAAKVARNPTNPNAVGCDDDPMADVRAGAGADEGAAETGESSSAAAPAPAPAAAPAPEPSHPSFIVAPFDAAGRKLRPEEIQWYADHGCRVDEDGDTLEPEGGLVSCGVGPFHPNADKVRAARKAREARAAAPTASSSALPPPPPLTPVVSSAELEVLAPLPVHSPLEELLVKIAKKKSFIEQLVEHDQVDTPLYRDAVESLHQLTLAKNELTDPGPAHDPARACDSPSLSSASIAELQTALDDALDEEDDDAEVPEDFGLDEAEQDALCADAKATAAEEAEWDAAFAAAMAEAESVAVVPPSGGPSPSASAPASLAAIEAPKTLKVKPAGRRLTDAQLSRLTAYEFFRSYNYVNAATAAKQEATRLKWKALRKVYTDRLEARAEKAGLLIKKKVDAKKVREDKRAERAAKAEERRENWKEGRGFNQMMTLGAKKEKAEADAEAGKVERAGYIVPHDVVADRKTKEIPKFSIGVAEFTGTQKIHITKAQLEKLEPKKKAPPPAPEEVVVDDPKDGVNVKLAGTKRVLEKRAEPEPKPPHSARLAAQRASARLAAAGSLI